MAAPESYAGPHIEEYFEPTRVIGVINPISTRASLVAERLLGVRERYDFVELQTSPDQEETIAKIMEVAEEGDLIVNGGGDGTMNDIVTTVARRDSPLNGKRIAITSAAGGNGNDFYHIAHGRTRPVHENIARGSLQTFNPIEVRVRRGDEDMYHYAACYFGAGLTGKSAGEFKSEAHRARAFYENSAVRLAYEGQLLLGALANAETFRVRHNDTIRDVTEITVANGPRMAKFGRLPVRLTDPELFVMSVGESRLAAAVSLGVLACGMMPGRKVQEVLFALESDTIGHVDAEPFALLAGDDVFVQQSEQPLFFIPTRSDV